MHERVSKSLHRGCRRGGPGMRSILRKSQEIVLLTEGSRRDSKIKETVK